MPASFYFGDIDSENSIHPRFSPFLVHAFSFLSPSPDPVGRSGVLAAISSGVHTTDVRLATAVLER